MKISIKTLNKTCFDIQANACDTIVDVKKQIENEHGAEVYPADKQVLIHRGKVLKDATTLEENNVVEDSFLVIMLSKANSAPSGGSSATPAGQAQSQTSTAPVTVPTLTTPQAQPQTVTESVAATATTAALPQTVTDSVAATATAAASGEANVYGQAASNFVAGSGLDSTIQQILDMGGGSWDRDTVVRALRAAFNNPERAIEYLYSGIPEQAEVPPVARAPVVSPIVPTGGQAAELPAQVPREALPSGGPNAIPLNLFPQGLPNVGSNAGAGSLDFLRNNRQFQVLRAMVQANPQILLPLLQELGKHNPHLMRLIHEHQDDFVRLLNLPVVGGEGNAAAQASAMQQTVSVTPEEQEAIERLEAMGFRRATVLQVFFACDKNETMAANYLLDHLEEFANEDDEGGLA